MSRARRRERLGRLVVAMRFGQRLGPGEQRLDPAAQVGRDAAAEEAGVDAEPGREPRDRLVGRARLPALDLADVLLREPVAGELGLGQAGRETKERRRSPSRAPRGATRTRGGVVGGGELGHGGWVHAHFSQAVSGVGARTPLRGFFGRRIACASGEAKVARNHLTKLLDFSGHRSYSEANLHRAGRQARCKGAPPRRRPPQPQERDRAAGSRSSELAFVAACLTRIVPGAAAGDVPFSGTGRNRVRDLREQIPNRAKTPEAARVELGARSAIACSPDSVARCW